MPGRVLRDKGGFLSPVVSVVPHGTGHAIRKDFGPRNAVTRGVIGPLLVRREWSILKRLEGVAGVPRVFEIADRGRALLLEYVAGRTLGKFKDGELPESVYAQIEETLAGVHRRGVVHLDLRQKKNVLVADADLRPWLIDFANAARVDGASPLRPLAEKLRAIDRSGLLKFKARYFSRLLTAADRETLRRHAKYRRLWVFSPHTVRDKDVVW